MALDFPGRHAARIHADDLGVELGEAAQVTGDQQRIERAVAVAGDVQNHLAAVGGHRLLAAAIAPIGRIILPGSWQIGMLLVQMRIKAHTQRTFRQRLRQFRQNAALAEQIARITALHQLVQEVFVYAHTRVSSFLSYHARAQNSG